jgi:type II restriction/modification system DNA methylase subunit YeeA
MITAGGNPNHHPNSDVVKRCINATDITGRDQNTWIIDFGPDMKLERAAEYELPFEYVVQHVKPIRDKVRRAAHRKKWWLFGDTRPGMRKAIAPLSRYIVTPRVSKHRLFVWAATSVVADSAVVAIANESDYFIGALHSKPHELWALRLGTSLEDRPRYTPTTTFETFPFPWPPGREPAGDPRVEAIAQAARELVEQRDAWLNPPGLGEKELQKRTLTNLYNQRPDWLDQAHRKLDEAVLDAYGWPHNVTDEEILERLLALNLERAAKQR